MLANKLLAAQVPSAAGGSGIEFVGFAGATYNASSNIPGSFNQGPINLTGLTGGMDTQARAGDFCLVTYTFTGASSTTYAAPPIPGDAVSIISAIGPYAPNTYIAIYYKIQGITPDASLSIFYPANTLTGVAATVFVFRGVNLITPLDVNPLFAVRQNSSNAQSASITPVTLGAVPLSIIGLSIGQYSTAYPSPPSGYVVARSLRAADTYSSGSGMVYYAPVTSLAQVSFSNWGYSIPANWLTTSILLRPA